ncbi:DUF4190 domain-containing protein [Leucobacter zeae]|nr:DUF4190 domain-containing protein [Leucobacter zeae]
MTNPVSPEQQPAGEPPYGAPEPPSAHQEHGAPLQPYAPYPAQQQHGVQQYGAAQQQYGAPQQPYGAQQTYALPASGYGRTTNVLAVISMISSIVGLLSFAILSVAGVVMGHIALSQIKRKGEQGRGMALAGVIVGYAGIALWVLIAIAWFAFIGFFITAAGASGTLS